MTDFNTKALEAAAIHLCAAIDNLWNHPDLRRIREEIPESIKLNISKGQMMTRTALAASGDGWLPIESAPKDGTRFLVFGGGADKIEVCTWNDTVGAWDLDHTMLEDYDHQSEGYSRPAHWRPLPAPPALTAQEKK